MRFYERKHSKACLTKRKRKKESSLKFSWKVHLRQLNIEVIVLKWGELPLLSDNVNFNNMINTVAFKPLCG